jgi:addiction module HigA family antidote
MSKASIKIGMKPPHPGQFVRMEILEELGLSIAKAAEALGVRAATVSDLVNEKSGLSPEMAMRLELAFGIKADTLLRMQAWFDAEAVRARAGELGVRRFVAEEA